MAPWHHQLFPRCYICVTLLEIMLRRVLVHISNKRRSNVRLDYVSPGKLVINISKRCQKSMTDCAAQEVGFGNLCEIVDGRPCSIDTLMQHRRMIFPLTEHESKELFRQYCLPGGPLSRQNGERSSMSRGDDVPAHA